MTTMTHPPTASLWLFTRFGMGDPLSLFTRVLPINTACPTSSAYVHGDFQYFPTQYTLTTPERCAEQCAKEILQWMRL